MKYVEVKMNLSSYQMGETTITANDDISFSIEKGELVIILGPSGAGEINGIEYFRWDGYTG